MKAKRRTKCLKLKAKCHLRSCSSCRGTKAAFEREAVVKPESGMYLIHRSVRFYDCCVAVAHHTERSLRSSAAATKTAQYTRTKQAGRSAASGCSAFDLPALPEGREEVLWSGPTGMDAGRAVMGHGWPVTAGHGTGPERGNLSAAKAVRRGEDLLVPFGSFQKGLAVRAKPIFQLYKNAGYVLIEPVKNRTPRKKVIANCPWRSA